MLTAEDSLPERPRRVLVAGVSGSGKTTLARRLSDLLGCPYVELDALFHGAGWVRRPGFEDDVDAFSAGERWVCEWQYNSVRDRLAQRADLLVWLDLPFPLVLSRVVRRTVSRRVRREVLWNGNREPPLYTFVTDREHVIRWAIRTRHLLAERVPVAAAENPDLTVVRLRSPRQVDHWVRTAVEPLA